MKIENHKWPFFLEEDIAAVSSVLESGKVNYWTGTQGIEFEKEFANYCGCKHAVAVSNGTVALELALRAIGVGVGDEVLVSPRTFIASASAIVVCGATPVMVDVDMDSQNISVESIGKAITPKTRAIILVHLAGWPCDMDAIPKLAESYGLKIIEDCAQAHGAKYRNKAVGSFGDISAFSFCQDKIMTTGGEGGMVVTNDEDLWKSVWEFKDHGKNYDTVFHKKHAPGFRWLHESFGSNYRMTEMQAAIGRVSIRKLDSWVNHRRENAEILSTAFSQVDGLRVTSPPDYIKHSFYKYYVFLKNEYLKREWSREKIIEDINRMGVTCLGGSCSEIYLEKAFIDLNLGPKKSLTNAKKLGETALMFLVDPSIKKNAIEKTVAIVNNTMKKAMK
jgi:dTDP-4-amino-4,6-dideoxygalactose transaminase